MALAIIIIYSLFLTFILVYSLIQLHLVFLYKKNKNNIGVSTDAKKNFQPFVTIQLPVFNEVYVIERLIKTVAQFSYPKDKFEIQILDDSTDETTTIISKVIDELRPDGVNVQLIRRPERVGFKAGALAYGMKIAKGDFIAIFDADFMPRPDFLEKTIPFFTDKKIGVVQTRWEHINEDYSILTQMQAFGLDAHFTVEQTGRSAGGHFINFNGTGGVWRKTCIEDAGGWSADTLTEDLDLSYRAQLKGWKFKYLENVGAPSELPAAMNALKNQQFRWTKGAAECARKNLFKVFRKEGIPLGTKLHAMFHLMNSFVFICILSMGILSVPLFYIRQNFEEYKFIFDIASLFVICVFIVMIFYWVAHSSRETDKLKYLKEFFWKFPFFLSVSMGMSLHNGIAVLEGLMGKKSPFIRTPKFNLQTASDQWKGNKYLAKEISFVTILEGFFMLYFMVGIVLSFYYLNFAMLPFFVMLAFGFGFVFYFSIRHSVDS